MTRAGDHGLSFSVVMATVMQVAYYCLACQILYIKLVLSENMLEGRERGRERITSRDYEGAYSACIIAFLIIIIS